MTAFSVWTKPVPAWKALLRPMESGGSYTISAQCTGCAGNATIAIADVTFGDVWYCSGQSNMWLPVSSTFSRNSTAAAIKNGQFGNVRIMAGNSGTPVPLLHF